MSETLRLPWKAALGALASLGAIGVGGYFAFAENGLDLLGDHPRRDISLEERMRQYARPWTAESRFSLQFLGKGVDGDDIDHPGGGGLLSLWGLAEYKEYPIGDNCLESTAYDTRPSEIRGRARGNISAVAALSVQEGIINIHPAGANSPPLKLETDEYGVLQPHDKQTAETLRAYGCSIPNFDDIREET